VTKKYELSPKEQHTRIKKVYGDFYACLTAQDWSTAFLIAYGLLETCINTMYRSEREFRYTQKLEPSANPDKHRPFRNQVNYLAIHQRLRPEEAEEIRQVSNTRNEIIHDFVWAAQEVRYDLCKHTLKLARKAQNARKRQKYWHKKVVNQDT
jgi:hypothetical protein